MQESVFAGISGVGGMSVHVFWVNPISAWLTLASCVGYAFIYKGYLKQATPQNSVIGGLSGAMPPLLGWAAVTGTIEPNALILVLIIFAWTPPHFWALAIHRKKEYAQTGIPMLPVTHGEYVTKVHIIIYTAILAVVSVFPYLTGMSGPLYLVSALALVVGFLVWSGLPMCKQKPTTAMTTFRYPLVHLPLLVVALMVDVAALAASEQRRPVAPRDEVDTGQ